MPVHDNTDPAVKSMQGLRARARLKRGGPSPAAPGLAARRA